MHVFNVLSEKSAVRFEELNNYSDLMTSRFCDAGMTKGRGGSNQAVSLALPPPGAAIQLAVLAIRTISRRPFIPR